MADSSKVQKCCWECFFECRGNSNTIICNHLEKKIQVFWNEDKGLYETTEVRTPPDNLLDNVWGNVQLCDPHRGTCPGFRCTFAHGTQEQNEWNRYLKSMRREAGATERPHYRKNVQANGPTGTFKTPRSHSLFGQGPSYLASDRDLGQPLSKATSYSKFSQPKQPETSIATAIIAADAKTYDKDFPRLAKKHISKRALKQLQNEGRNIGSFSFPKFITRPHSRWYTENKEKWEKGVSILEKDLSSDNYTKKFHHLLFWEEQEHDRLLSEQCDGMYEVHIYQSDFKPYELTYENEQKFDRYGYINSDNGDILSHAKQASEGSFISLDNGYVHVKHVFVFPPKNANSSAIVFGLYKEDTDKMELPPRSVTFRSEIVFELKHGYFGRLHNALHYLLSHAVARLNPTTEELSNPKREPSHYYHSPEPPYEHIQLDETQKKALHVILNATHEFPILLAGPFGTGKTRLLARAAYDILGKRSSRVLICAHHQTSVDTFVEIFGKIYELHDQEVIRIIPNGTYHSSTHNNYKEWFETIGKVTEERLAECRLVITTLGIAPGLYRKLPGDKRRFFSDILIDEGAQTREPETIGPLSLAGKYTRIVIAGDHCQVGPKSLVLGNKAQKYGLGKSLLERMHNIYDKADLPINTYSVTLFSNYRCHSGVLMLPSNLFYKSTLQCCVPDHECHPDAPFPLVFVCSSLDEDIRNIKGVNQVEIDAVMDEVENYFSKWPKHWDDEDQVCIMSPSANQVSEIKRRVKNKSKVEVLKAYDIQGTQFRAIVISTSEPTSQDGRCIYETKSICDRYVFNTAITRSRSLVVAVGNPFLLLELENQMIEKYGEDGVRCWSAYMGRCIECKTFRYSKKLQNNYDQSTSEKLLNMIYKSSTTSKAISRPTDSILKAYQKVLERSKEYKDTKLLLSSIKGSLSWKVESKKHEDTKETENDDFSDEYECILEVINIRMAKAIPLDNSKPIVTIHGMDNRKPAFDGDTVLVGIFGNCPETDSTGKVMHVLKESNRKFICKVTGNPIVFYPIDKKNPALINLPRLSRDFLKLKGDNNIKDDNNNVDLKVEDVVVFEVPDMHHDDSEEILLPKIKHVIPLPVAKNMLFLVAYVKWGHKYRTPLGIAEEVFPKGFTQFNAERIIKFQHGVEYNDDRMQTNFAVDQLQDSGVFSKAFTIDPEGAENLDDALSIIKHVTDTDSKMTYQLAVHIINAAKHIEAGSVTDTAARERGISVYGEVKGK